VDLCGYKLHTFNLDPSDIEYGIGQVCLSIFYIELSVRLAWTEKITAMRIE